MVGYVPRYLLVFSLMVLFVAACGDDGDSANEAEEPHAVPDFDFGKSDNYIGTNAREFVLLGEFTEALPEGYDDATDPEHQEELLDDELSDQLNLIGDSVERHIDDVIREHNEELDDHQVEYFVYFRSDSTLDTDFEVEGDEVQYSFELEFVGSVYLMGLLADDSSPRTFEVDIYSSPFGGEVVDQMELEIQGSPSRDAFPSYDALFEDGMLDISMHFGGDYNEGRYDLDTAEWTVETLLETGWQHQSVDSFDDLRIDSGPFYRQLRVEGQQLEVLVSVFHAEMKEDEVDGEPVGHEGLRDAVEESMEITDIFLYSGHAGSDAGFILDYSPRYEIPATEFVDMPMSDDYQIYVMDGCNTYRTYVRDIMDNPARNFGNTDIMTTVHTTPFSAGYYVIWQLLNWFTFTDQAGNHFPVSWQTMIRGLNQDFDDVHYGVHGVDDAPKLNPHASEGYLCEPCSSDADCGAGGNYCLGYEDGAGCGVACTTDAACGEGYRCARVFDIDDEFYMPKQCVPTTMSCGN